MNRRPFIFAAASSGGRDEEGDLVGSGGGGRGTSGGDADPRRPGDHRQRACRGQDAGVRREGVSGDFVCGAPGPRVEMARTAASTAVERRISRRPEDARVHTAAAPAQYQSLFRRGAHQRRLPVPERMGAYVGKGGLEPAGDRFHLWRWVHHRIKRHGAVRRCELGQTGRGIRELQLPGRRPGLPGASAAYGGIAETPVGQLRAPGPGGCAAVDPSQHCAVRRRSGEGGDLRSVGGGRVGIAAAGKPTGQGAFPRRRRDERREKANGDFMGSGQRALGIQGRFGPPGAMPRALPLRPFGAGPGGALLEPQRGPGESPGRCPGGQGNPGSPTENHSSICNSPA